MTVGKNHILESLTSYLEPFFSKHEFQLKRKSSFEKNLTEQLVLQYEILLNKKARGAFYLALRLNLLDKVIASKVNLILRKVMNDDRYHFPPAFDDKIIARMKKERTSSNWIYGMTDWRQFKSEDETLPEFNQTFNIWLASFTDLDTEIPDWQAQLKKSVAFAQKWFTDNATEDIIINNTRYPSLVLLAEKGDREKLNQRYQQIREADLGTQSEDRVRELDLFWEYLNKERQ